MSFGESSANCYSHGSSERFIDNAIKELGILREKQVIASKVYFNDGKLSKNSIFREIDKTLANL